MIGVCLGFVLILSLSMVSAGWFGDMWNRMSGNDDVLMSPGLSLKEKACANKCLDKRCSMFKKDMKKKKCMDLRINKIKCRNECVREDVVVESVVESDVDVLVDSAVGEVVDCIDTDGGFPAVYGINESGVVTVLLENGSYYTVEDSCVESEDEEFDGWLLEYFCHDGQMSSHLFGCEVEGRVCLNGECVLPFCEDSEGGVNYYDQGNLSYFFIDDNPQYDVSGIHYTPDVCAADGYNLSEFSCDNYNVYEMVEPQRYDCSLEGMVCIDGACVEEEEEECEIQCFDEDELDYFNRSYVRFDFRWNGEACHGYGGSPDDCLDDFDTILREQICVDNQNTFVDYDCAEIGMVCRSGECVEEEEEECVEIRITTDLNYQGDPAIYGDKIVWRDDRNVGGDVNRDIYMYDLSTNTETQITTDLSYQQHPAIYGDKIVWEDYRNGNVDIYMYDLSTNTETQITTDSNYQGDPAIYGDKIVWRDYRNEGIYMYDLSTNTETQISMSLGHQRDPAIYGDRIVWSMSNDIYMYDLFTNTETQITADSSLQVRPAIYGDKIIWQQDYGNGNESIYVYDLSTNTETQIFTNLNNQWHPISIYGDKIVWQNYENRNGDIYMYDLFTNTETQITADLNDQGYPAIYSDKIVWEDYRDGNVDIYMCELSGG